MSVVVQYVVKPNPGSDLATILEVTHDSAVLWRKYGGEVSFWAVSVGEVGDFVFSVGFETLSAYGAAVDKLNADPAFQAWQVKRLKVGMTSWVRGNLMTEIKVGR
jgi:hypothetical protein